MWDEKARKAQDVQRRAEVGGQSEEGQKAALNLSLSLSRAHTLTHITAFMKANVKQCCTVTSKGQLYIFTNASPQ